MFIASQMLDDRAQNLLTQSEKDMTVDIDFDTVGVEQEMKKQR